MTGEARSGDGNGDALGRGDALGNGDDLGRGDDLGLSAEISGPSLTDKIPERTPCGGMFDPTGMGRASPPAMSGIWRGSAAYDSGKPCILMFRRRKVMN